jgi:hypothetical protein
MIAMMRNGVAIPAAVARMTAANNPATVNFKNGKPVFRAVDAAAGAEHEFQEIFHGFSGRCKPQQNRRKFVAGKRR